MSDQNTCCCSTTFRDYVYQCPDSITIYTLNLEADTDYTVLIQSHLFGSIALTATTDADGYLVIDIADLPEGFINQHSGDFSIKVFEFTEEDTDLAACAPVRLLLAKYYDDIVIHAKHGDAVKSTIACELPELIVSE